MCRSRCPAAAQAAGATPRGRTRRPQAAGRGGPGQFVYSVDQVARPEALLVLRLHRVARAYDRVVLVEPAQPELVDRDRALRSHYERSHAFARGRRLLEP